jgi:hypothetical protein
VVYMWFIHVLPTLPMGIITIRCHGPPWPFRLDVAEEYWMATCHCIPKAILGIMWDGELVSWKIDLIWNSVWYNLMLSKHLPVVVTFQEVNRNWPKPHWHQFLLCRGSLAPLVGTRIALGFVRPRGPKRSTKRAFGVSIYDKTWPWIS